MHSFSQAISATALPSRAQMSSSSRAFLNGWRIGPAIEAAAGRLASDVLVLRDDEAAADRVVDAGFDFLAVGVTGDQPKGVWMTRRRRLLVEDEITVRIEGDLAFATERKAL